MKLILKAARVNACLSVGDMADIVNVSKATVRNWESGKTSPRVDQLNTYCDACGISSADIILPSNLTKSLMEV